jgi:hypothetical protein
VVGDPPNHGERIMTNRKSGEELVEEFEEAVLDMASMMGNYSPFDQEKKTANRKKIDQLRQELIEICDLSKDLKI